MQDAPGSCVDGQRVCSHKNQNPFLASAQASDGELVPQVAVGDVVDGEDHAERKNPKGNSQPAHENF